ncbi:PAS domain-containing protein [Pedobacter endophyticus]|nr:PAS domain-containing protein [Pedobacter endophyticus]
MIQPNQISGNTFLLEALSLSNDATAIYTSEELHIAFVNNGMLRIWGKDKTVVGKTFEQAIPEIVGQPFTALLQNVWRTGKTFKAHNTPANLEIGGVLGTYYFDFEYRALTDETGLTYCLLHTATDVTERVAAEQAIKFEESQREALENEQALNGELAATNEELMAVNDELQLAQTTLQELNEDLEIRVAEGTQAAESARHRLEAMVMNTPIAMAILRTKDLIVEIANGPMLTVWRRTLDQVLERSLVEIFPELHGQPNPERMRGVMESRKRFSLPETEVILGTVDGTLKSHYARFSYDPIFEQNGEVESILVTVINITEEVNNRKQLEMSSAALKESTNKLALINRELSAINEEYMVINEELESANQELVVAQAQLLRETQEKQLANDRLSANEENLRNIVKQAPVGMCILQGDPLFVVEINDIFLEIIGKPREAFDDLPYWEVNAEAKAFYEPITTQVISTGSTYYANEHEIALMRNGKPETVHVNFVYEPLKDADNKPFALMIVAVDITTQVLARKKIEESEKHFRSLADIVPAKISNALPGGEVTFFNQQWLDYSGMNFEDLRDFGYHEMMHPDEIPEFQRRLKAAAAKGVALEMEMRFKDINGNYRWHLNITSPILDSQGQITMWVGSTTDIERIKEEEQRKDDFIGMVSHELKTPLTSLNAFLQILQRKARNIDDSSSLGPLDRSLSQVKKMTTMINGFLNVSRLEAGKINIDKSSFELGEVMKEIEEEFMIMISSHQIRFSSNGEVQINADRDKISQVISNLISNAVKYSPGGSTIWVRSETVDKEIRVSVKDNGMGISAEDQPKLFDRYYRVEGQQMKTIAGFGIGLYLCAEIIYRHAGKIGVESQIGEGSEFWFSIPL